MNNRPMTHEEKLVETKPNGTIIRGEQALLFPRHNDVSSNECFRCSAARAGHEENRLGKRDKEREYTLLFVNGWCEYLGS